MFRTAAGHPCPFPPLPYPGLPFHQVASGKVSATQQDVSVAYCACAYDILAVTVGILTGGHVGKLFDSWSEHGFGKPGGGCCLVGG